MSSLRTLLKNKRWKENQRNVTTFLYSSQKLNIQRFAAVMEDLEFNLSHKEARKNLRKNTKRLWLFLSIAFFACIPKKQLSRLFMFYRYFLIYAVERLLSGNFFNHLFQQLLSSSFRVEEKDRTAG